MKRARAWKLRLWRTRVYVGTWLFGTLTKVLPLRVRRFARDLEVRG